MCFLVCYNSDLAQDLTVLEEHFGYNYIELQLVSWLAYIYIVITSLFSLYSYCSNILLLLLFMKKELCYTFWK